MSDTFLWLPYFLMAYSDAYYRFEDSREPADAKSPRDPPRQYSKCQTRGDEIQKCLDKGLEPTNFFSINGLEQKLSTSCCHLALPTQVLTDNKYANFQAF